MRAVPATLAHSTSRLAGAILAAVIDPSASVHPSAIVEEPVELGAQVRVWCFCHVRSGAAIGEGSSLGLGCYVAPSARIGRGCRLQNHVSVFDGVVLEDEVFLGPSVVIANVRRPRAHVVRRHEFERTVVRVREGATVGANATVLPGVTLGRYSFVAAGAVVTRDVRDHELVVGAPARHRGWVSRHGERLDLRDGVGLCPATGERYRLVADALCLEPTEE